MADQTHLGIKDTKEALIALIRLGKVGYECYADDQKFSLGDAARFLALGPTLFTGIAGINNIDDELRDLDQSEGSELIAAVRAEVGDLPIPHLQRILNAATGLLPALGSLMKLFNPEDEAKAAYAQALTGSVDPEPEG